MSRRNYSSIAAKTTLAAGIVAGDTSFTVAALSGYPATPFTAILDRGTASEEVITVTNVAVNTVTVLRGVDGTTATSHAGTTGTFEHGTSARDFDEPNAHIQATTSVHGIADTSQLLTVAAANAAYAPIGGTAFVGAQASRTTAQSIPNSTLTAITWPTEVFDTNAFHDLVTNPSRLTVPTGKAGYYRIDALVDWASTVGGTTRSIRVTVNGVSIASAYLAPGSNDVTNTIDVIAHLSVGDYVEVFGYQDSGGAVNVGALGTVQPCLVSVHLLGT